MQEEAARNQLLRALCEETKALLEQKNYKACLDAITQAMAQHPHAPQPHNLMGIVLERQGDRRAAMKHFRAAWALDPSYLPCRVNLQRHVSFASKGAEAFDEADCPPEEENTVFGVEYDEFGTGHLKWSAGNEDF